MCSFLGHPVDVAQTAELLSSELATRCIWIKGPTSKGRKGKPVSKGMGGLGDRKGTGKGRTEGTKRHRPTTFQYPVAIFVVMNIKMQRIVAHPNSILFSCSLGLHQTVCELSRSI